MMRKVLGVDKCFKLYRAYSVLDIANDSCPVIFRPKEASHLFLLPNLEFRKLNACYGMRVMTSKKVLESRGHWN